MSQPQATQTTSRPPTAVLLSAGLDSAVLAAAEARYGEVHPVYVSVGLAWEANELAMLSALLATRAVRGRSRRWRVSAFPPETCTRPPTGPSSARRPVSTRRTRTSTSPAGT